MKNESRKMKEKKQTERGLKQKTRDEGEEEHS